MKRGSFHRRQALYADPLHALSKSSPTIIRRVCASVFVFLAAYIETKNATGSRHDLIFAILSFGSLSALALSVAPVAGVQAIEGLFQMGRNLGVAFAFPRRERMRVLVMKWTMFNALGGLAWIAGLSFAKGVKFLGDDIFAVGDHRVFAGLSLGLAGLFLIFWTNIRNPA